MKHTQDIRLRSPERKVSGAVITIVTLVVFFLVDNYDWALFRLLASDTEGWARFGAAFALRDIPQLVIICVLAILLFGARHVRSALGLDRSFLKGIAFGIGVTAIMAVILFTTSPLTTDTLVRDVVRVALMPGIREEFWYRAFLFGFLFRFAGWGFFPAALLGALIFGSAHLYQSGDPLEAGAIFAITALGGLWFAWLFSEWDFNIWVPASVHVLMNAWWEIFAISDTALGTGAANAARLAVIALSIAITLAHARKRGGRIVRGQLWLIGSAADAR